MSILRAVMIPSWVTPVVKRIVAAWRTALRNDSSWLYSRRTGRPMTQAMPAHSGRTLAYSLPPNEPPTNGMTIRTADSGRPTRSPTSLDMRYGYWLDPWTVMPPGEGIAVATWFSIEAWVMLGTV